MPLFEQLFFPGFEFFLFLLSVVLFFLLVRLVAIAQQLVLMAAFGPASAIIGGLLSPAVMRLKKTAELVEIDTQNLMKELEKLIAPEKNHKHYREMLQVTLLEKKPCCPYLGLYLADLTFIEDGNPDKRGDMINFDKRCMLGKVLSEILRFQNIRYMFRPVPALQWFLSNQTPLSEKQAYDLSLTQEPRTK
jgi:son of sevenless-like protein